MTRAYREGWERVFGGEPSGEPYGRSIQEGLFVEAFVREWKKAFPVNEEPQAGKVVVHVTMPPATLVRTGPGRFAYIELSDRIKRKLEGEE
jgi:hypothetical protein